MKQRREVDGEAAISKMAETHGWVGDGKRYEMESLRACLVLCIMRLEKLAQG